LPIGRAEGNQECAAFPANYIIRMQLAKGYFVAFILEKAPIKHLLAFFLTRDPQVFPQLPI
jgi:hypothetical protein